MKTTYFPVVASDFDAWYPEFDVFVDVGGVSGTTINHQSNNTVHIDLSIASLSRDPVRGVLANNLALHDGAFGLEMISDAFDVTGPRALGTTVGKGGLLIRMVYGYI